MPEHPPRARLHPDEQPVRHARPPAGIMNADATPEVTAEAEALAMLGQACAAAGLSADGARLLRLGSNAVYRLAAPVVARIAYAGTDAEAARRTVEVARWLESADYPAVRALDLDQPVVIDGHPVTFWGALSDTGDEYATIDQVADVIARLHKLTTPEGLMEFTKSEIEAWRKVVRAANIKIE